MFQAILSLLGRGASLGSRAVKSTGRGIGWAVTRDPLAVAKHKAKPKKFPLPRTPLGSAVHGMAEFGNASWGIDSIASRFNSSAPTFMESVTVKVYGQRWALIEDLYVLAMCIVVARVDGRSWQGGQGVRCVIDVTGKYVEVEFQQTKRGIAERFGTGVANLVGPNRSPFTLFHDPDWLTNEVRVVGKARAIERLPDVLAPAGNAEGGGLGGTPRQTFEGGWAEQGHARDELAEFGGFTGHMVVNQGPANSLDGLKLVTHDRDVNPHPISDGASRGTDLCALVAQLLHDPGTPPPVPETDRTYLPTDETPDVGCRTYRVPGPRPWQWLKQAAANAARWAKGFNPLRAGPPGKSRSYTPPGC